MFKLFPTLPPLPEPLQGPFRIFLVVAAILLLGLLIEPLVDPDVFIHLRDGRFSLQTGMSAAHDPFTYTVDKAQDKLEWLFQIFLYTAYRVVGFNGLILLKAVAVTFTVFLLGALVYRRWPHAGVAGGLVALGVLSSLGLVWGERPFVFTYLFLAVCLWLLDSFQRAPDTDSRRAGLRLWLIPVLVVPWANLHPGFMVVFVFLGSHALEALFSWGLARTPAAAFRLKTLSGVILASFLAGALNSVGFGIYHFVFSTVGSPLYMNTVMEWLPPEFSAQYWFFLLLVLAWAVQWLTFRKVRLADLLPLLVFSYLAVKSRRNIPLFVAAALPPLAGQLRWLAATWFGERELSLDRRRLGYGLGTLLLAGLTVYATLTAQAFRWGEYRDWHPKQGLNWLVEHGFRGKLFCEFAWGGYVTWQTRGSLRVFMDGRLPFFGEDLYSDYSRIYYGDPACTSLLNKYGVQALLVSPKNYFGFFERIGNSPEWALVYWDHVSEVYLRREPGLQDLIRQNEYSAVDPNSTPYFDPTRLAAAVAEVQRAKAAAPGSYLPVFFEGDLKLQAGDLPGARSLLESSLRMAPKHAHSLFDLGLIAYKQDQPELAAGYLTRALRCNDKPDFQAKTCHLLALVSQQRPGQEQTALRWARKALRSAPDWPAAQELVQKLQLQTLTSP